MSESFPSAEVSTFSFPLTPSPWSAEDSCPTANAWLLKSCAGIKKNSLPWHRGSDRLIRRVSRLHVFLRKRGLRGVCMQGAPAASVQIRGADEAKLPLHIERRQVGATALTKCLQAPESIWGETFLQTRRCIQFVIPRVWTAWGNTHLAWGVRPDSSVCISLKICWTLIWLNVVFFFFPSLTLQKGVIVKEFQFITVTILSSSNLHLKIQGKNINFVFIDRFTLIFLCSDKQ